LVLSGIAALQKLKHEAALDGEAVVFNEDGYPDFDALQTYSGLTTPIAYCVFDILWLDGYDTDEEIDFAQLVKIYRPEGEIQIQKENTTRANILVLKRLLFMVSQMKNLSAQAT